MPLEDTSVREAGELIAQRGLTDDVRKGRTNRELARDGDSADADDRTEDRRAPKRRQDDDREDRQPKRRRDDDEDDRPRTRRRDEDEDDADDDADDFEDDADTSNREDGEDGDEDDDERQDDEDDDTDGDGDDDRNREREFEVKVDGKRFKVTENELIAGYQRGRDYAQKTQRIAETGRTLQNGHNQAAEQLAKRLQDMSSFVSTLRKSLVGEMDGAQMERLYNEDPVAWQKARATFEKRIKDVDAVFSHINQEQERHRRDTEAVQTAHKSRLVEHEISLLSRHIPDWMEGKDGKPAGYVRVAQYLRGAGFQDQEFTGIVDHRMLLIADKARRYDAMMKRRDERGEPRRKPQPVPKRIPKGSGSRNVASQGNRQDRQDKNEFNRARDRLAKSGDMRDAGNAIDAMLSRKTRREERKGRRFR